MTHEKIYEYLKKSTDVDNINKLLILGTPIEELDRDTLLLLCYYIAKDSDRRVEFEKMSSGLLKNLEDYKKGKSITTEEYLEKLKGA